MPSTSPRCTSNETFSTTKRPGFAGSATDRFSTASAVSACTDDGRGYSVSTARPTIIEITRAGVIAVVSSVPTERPSRSTVMRSEMRKTSSRRWLT